VRQHTCPQALALRATIILRAASGERTTVLARALSCSPTTARTWRRRWAGAQAVLAAADADLPTLEHTIGQVLADAPRPGAPDTFTAEQIVQIINLACTPPAASGRPITTWTPREVAAEAVKQGIVRQISPQSVARFLKSGRAVAAPQSLLAQCQNEGG